MPNGWLDNSPTTPRPFLSTLLYQGWKSLPHPSPASLAAQGDHITLLEVARAEAKTVQTAKQRNWKNSYPWRHCWIARSTPDTTGIHPRFLFSEMLLRPLSILLFPAYRQKHACGCFLSPQLHSHPDLLRLFAHLLFPSKLLHQPPTRSLLLFYSSLLHSSYII